VARKTHSEPRPPLSHDFAPAAHSDGDPSPGLTGAPAAIEHREAGTLVPSPAVAPAHPATGRSLPEAQHGSAAAGTSAFQRLDQAPPVTTLHAGPQRLSIGVEDPVRGWVEVRSESRFGDLSATLTVASEAVHGALRAELPAMNGYLADHHVDLNQLNIEQRFNDASGSGGHPGDSRAAPDRGPAMEVALVDSGARNEYGGYADASGVDIRA
jgi:hypothetical protein